MEDRYEELAPVYDIFAGERQELPRLRKLIKAHAPSAQSVLELACGTGAILEDLSSHYEVFGIDISEPMLKKARAKIAHGRFERQDMRAFDVQRSFDVVLCVFNSLNHLSRFRDWEQTFARVARHLRPGGLFLFDINTPRGLKGYVAEGLRVEERDGRVIIWGFNAAPRGGLRLEIKLFDGLNPPLYRLYRAEIIEHAFKTNRVRSTLQRHFSKVSMIDFERVKASTASEELYFVCIK